MSELQKQTSPAEVGAGGWWESTNNTLSDALNLWQKVEEIKGVKAASGQDQAQAMLQPELANGAAVQVDATLNQSANDGGFKVKKDVLYASLGLLGLAFILRMKGFK